MIYVLYEMANIEDVDFSKVVEGNKENLRISLDGTLTVLKFQGDTPSFLEGVKQYNHSEMYAIMQTPEWTNED